MAALPPVAAPPPGDGAAVVAVAFSGGFDSLALLHATCRAAAGCGVQVVALHVHHGLLPEADAWLARAQRLCARWRRRGWPLTLCTSRLSGRPAPGDSLEAWARDGRYAALAQMATAAGARLVLLAQHRRDQAETVLLQALRGGGPAGLAAMPVAAERAGLTWARPWLDAPRAAIDAYLRRHRLRPVEDPSNADARLARGRLRAQLWPALLAAFPDAEAALAQAARRAHEARTALDELAALDLGPLVDARGRLSVAGWRALSPARQANALRAWWRGQTGQAVSSTLVQRLLNEVPATGSRRWPGGRGRDCVLYRGQLGVRVSADGESDRRGGDDAMARHGPSRPLASGRSAAAPSDRADAGASAVVPEGAAPLDLSVPGSYALPGGAGRLVVAPTEQGGVAAVLLRGVRAAPRRGGERFQRLATGPARSLKKAYQSAAVPAHARVDPLLWTADGRLLFVPGLGLDARAAALPGTPRLTLHWLPGAGAWDHPHPAG